MIVKTFEVPMSGMLKLYSMSTALEHWVEGEISPDLKDWPSRTEGSEARHLVRLWRIIDSKDTSAGGFQLVRFEILEKYTLNGETVKVKLSLVLELLRALELFEDDLDYRCHCNKPLTIKGGRAWCGSCNPPACQMTDTCPTCRTELEHREGKRYCRSCKREFGGQDVTRLKRSISSPAGDSLAEDRPHEDCVNLRSSENPLVLGGEVVVMCLACLCNDISHADGQAVCEKCGTRMTTSGEILSAPCSVCRHPGARLEAAGEPFFRCSRQECSTPVLRQDLLENLRAMLVDQSSAKPSYTEAVPGKGRLPTLLDEEVKQGCINCGGNLQLKDGEWKCHRCDAPTSLNMSVCRLCHSAIELTKLGAGKDRYQHCGVDLDSQGYPMELPCNSCDKGSMIRKEPRHAINDEVYTCSGCDQQLKWVDLKAIVQAQQATGAFPRPKDK